MNLPAALAASPPQKNFGAAARPIGSSQTRGCRSSGANPLVARVAGDPLLLQIGDGIWRPIFFRHALEPGEVDLIRTATNGNYVLGNERFAAEVANALQKRVSPGKSGRPRKTPEPE